MQKIRKLVTNFVIGALCGAAISIMPVVLVNYKHVDLFFSSLKAPLVIFFAVCVMSGIWLYTNSQYAQKLQGRKTRLLLLWGIVYLFFYTACAALCQKEALTIIISNSCLGSDFSMISILGLFLVFLADVILIKKASFLPFYWSWLLFMAGASLIFTVWLPLIALPGAYCVGKWIAAGRLSMPEAYIK